MATSKSNSAWTCRLLIFSGRENPEWRPHADVLQKLLDLTQTARPYDQDFDMPAPLGYGGVELIGKTIRIHAYNGRMQIDKDQDTSVLTDQGREFEQMILKSVPKKFKSISFSIQNLNFN